MVDLHHTQDDLGNPPSKGNGLPRTSLAQSLTQSAALLEELCERASGDQHHIGRLLDEARPRLLRLVNVRMSSALRSRVDADDIVQETCLAAVNKFPEFFASRQVPVIVWLRRLAIERIIEATRKHVDADKRAVRREISVATFLADSNLAITRALVIDEKSPSRIVSDRDRAHDLERALEMLGERDREVIVLRFFEALTLAETAATMSISVANAKVLQFRAIRKLEKLFAESLGWKSADRHDERQQ